MATAENCSICNKGSGVYFCTGCKKYFCAKDFRNHREKLTNELDGFTQDRNTLHEKLATATQQEDTHSPFISQINEWEKGTIKKVQQAAEQARQSVLQIISSTQMETTSKFEKFSKTLIEFRETEDFTEQHLATLKQTLQQLQQDVQGLTQPYAVELHMEEDQKIEWSRIIYVARKIDSFAQKLHQNYGKFIT